MNNSMELMATATATRILKQSNFVGRRAPQKISFIEVRPSRIFKEEITFMSTNGVEIKDILYLTYTGKAYTKNSSGCWSPVGEFYGKIPIASIPKGALTPLLGGVELS